MKGPMRGVNTHAGRRCAFSANRTGRATGLPESGGGNAPDGRAWCRLGGSLTRVRRFEESRADLQRAIDHRFQPPYATAVFPSQQHGAQDAAGGGRGGRHVGHVRRACRVHAAGVELLLFEWTPERHLQVFCSPFNSLMI